MNDTTTKRHDKNMAISMSEVYSTSTLGSKQVRDYLQSFSQTTLEIKDSLECSYHLKQKSEKKCKLYRSMKPYIRDILKEKLTKTKPLTHNLVLSQSNNNSSLENEIKKEMKNTANSKSLTVKRLDGTMTEITLKPIVLLHVREIPAASGKVLNKEMYQLVSTTPPHSSCQLKGDSKVLPENPDSQLQINCESQNHSNINILRVKSSHNCTDLSSERKLSCMKTNNDIIPTPENFRRPNCPYQIGRGCVIANMSSIKFGRYPSPCYCNHDSKLSCIKKDIMGGSTCEYTRHDHSYENFSVTTFFRYPLPIPSNTSEYIQGVSHSPKSSDMNIK